MSSSSRLKVMLEGDSTTSTDTLVWRPPALARTVAVPALPAVKVLPSRVPPVAVRLTLLGTVAAM